jgi:hypothetical protein
MLGRMEEGGGGAGRSFGTPGSGADEYESTGPIPPVSGGGGGGGYEDDIPF